MQRRDLLKIGAYGIGTMALRPSLAAMADTGTSPVTMPMPVPIPAPIIDAHIHLFDPTRSGGVPWPEPADTTLYKQALPDRYEALSRTFGVVGAIAIEASPLATDNQWLLDTAAKYPVMVGVIGDLTPGASSYLAELERLHRNPLFLGFRYGNLWGRDLLADLVKPGFLDGLKALAQAGLVFETANPDERLIRAILRISQAVPGLRIVIDHLPNAKLPTETAALTEYWANLRTLAQNPRVYTKLSEIPALKDGKPVTDVGYYQRSLDELWEIFTEDRVLFGSDWPNSDHILPYAETVGLVQRYIQTKSATAVQKYYWKNSVAAYRWKPRRPDQPSL